MEVMGLSEAHLSPISTDHALHMDVIAPFFNMQKAAAVDGVDLQVCSSFRSFGKQLSIWNRKWQGDLPLNTLDGKTLDANTLNNNEKIHAIMLWSALPGASRHHWGSDFDVFDQRKVDASGHNLCLVPSEYENSGPCAELSQWIKNHASEYGFYLPYAKYVGGVAEEPWHMSHRQTAHKIQQNFAIEQLYAQLEQADILGKVSILKQLPTLVKRYTFNEGIK